MVMPAIHLTRRGRRPDLLGTPGSRRSPDDIPALVRVAREELRREILEAPGRADRGQRPDRRERLDHARHERRQRPAGGDGPARPHRPRQHGKGRAVHGRRPAAAQDPDQERHRPADLELCLVHRRTAPGGRSISSSSTITARELRADAKFRDVLRCIKCSACLNVCPVYQVIGGEEFSHVYMGGIGSLLTAWIHGLEESKELAGLCMGCHRCDTSARRRSPSPTWSRP